MEPKEYPKINMLQIHYFLKVAEKGSFTSAAKQLYTTQSTLSKTIISIEQTLGLTLFIRSHKRLILTDAGKHLYKVPTIPKEVVKYEEPVDLDQLLDGLTLAKLQSIFESIMKRQENKIDPIRSRFGTIEKEEVSLSEKMLEMKEYAGGHRKFSFRQLLVSQKSRVQLIVTFLSILELMKMGYIHVEQDALFDDILVEVVREPQEWTHLTEFADE